MRAKPELEALSEAKAPVGFLIRIAPDHFTIKIRLDQADAFRTAAEEDRPGVPIAPPLLFVLPILASLALEWFVPTSFVHGAVRWTLGALFFVAGIALDIGGFMIQKHAGTDPIPFNPSTRIVAHGLYRFIRNPMYSEERYLERKFGEEYLNYKRRVRRWI